MRTRQGQVLYDIRSDRPAIGNEFRGGLAGVLIGVLLLVAVWKRPEAAPRRFVLAFILAWAGWSLWSGLRVVRSHEAALEALNRGRARVAEGVVTDFVRERADGEPDDDEVVGRVVGVAVGAAGVGHGFEPVERVEGEAPLVDG